MFFDVVFQIAFLRYSQQWKKKVIFVLNKADIYQNTSEVYLCLLIYIGYCRTDMVSSSSFVVKYPK